MLRPVLELCCVWKEECGKRVCFLGMERFPARGIKEINAKGEVAESFDGAVDGDYYRVNWNNEIMPLEKVFRKVKVEGLGQRVMDHTLRAFEIETGRAFTE